MAISVAARKQQGRKLQQYVRDSFIDLLKGWGVAPGDVKSTSMGASGKDVTLSPYAKAFLPVSVECKSHSRMAIYGLYEQAKSNTESDEEPLLVVKINNRNPLAVIDFDYYLELERARIEREADE
jgi:hypothetical protein